MKKLLMIAFHFPPVAKGSGWQRSLAFARHLYQHGWQASVLSAKERAYERVDTARLADLPTHLRVIRAGCLDTARHLAVLGRYPARLAIPDRWVSWVPFGILAGLREIRRNRPAAIWVTYPLASALRIGYRLSRLSGLPLVVDFRDPMVEQDARTGQWHPGNRALRTARLAIERRCVEQAAALVFCTHTARDIVIERYGADVAERAHVIANGFDEAAMARIESQLPPLVPTGRGRPLTLLHSGLIYHSTDRDPSQFFTALSRLKADEKICSQRLRVILRASGSEPVYQKMLNALGIDDIVELAPPISHSEAVQEMFQADGLLVFQGYTSNPAIPAKLYEYMRTGRPVIGLVDRGGETAKLIEREGLGPLADIESASEIQTCLEQFQNDPTQPSPSQDGLGIAAYRRETQAEQLATLMSGLGPADRTEAR